MDIGRIPRLFEQVPGQAAARLFSLGLLVLAQSLGGKGSRKRFNFSEKFSEISL